MNKLNRLFIGLIALLSIVWASKLYRHFYGLTVADVISMIALTLLLVVLLIRLDLKLRKPFELLLFFSLLLLPFIIYPLVSRLIQITDLSWLAISAFLIISVGGAAILRDIRKQMVLTLSFVSVLFYPLDFESAQTKFFDRVVDNHSTRKADIQLVTWKGDYWLYYDNQLQYTTVDRHIYQEAYIQPVMQFLDSGASVLVMGGDNGALESELSKFHDQIELTILPWDASFFKWVRSNDELQLQKYTNKHVFFDEVFFEFLDSHPSSFDLIILDMPDPLDLEYTQFYSMEFLKTCFQALNTKGMLASQSGDIFKNRKNSNKIWQTAKEAGFHVFPYHAQIPTIGQWSWFIGAKALQKKEMQARLNALKQTSTRWWDQEAMNLMMGFGKDTFYENPDTTIFALNR